MSTCNITESNGQPEPDGPTPKGKRTLALIATIGACAVDLAVVASGITATAVQVAAVILTGILQILAYCCSAER